MEINAFAASMTSPFPSLVGMLEKHSTDEIMGCVCRMLSLTIRELGLMPIGGYAKGTENGAYYFTIKDLKRNLPHYRWVYGHLADRRSAEVLHNLMRYRILPVPEYLADAYDADAPQGYDSEIILEDSGGLLELKRRIRDESPKLAVYVHHIMSDIWEVPRLIHAINPEYTFYIRHHSENTNSNTLIYAIPRGRKAPSAPAWNASPGVYVPTGIAGQWENVQLLKDCGLIPYLLYKNHGYQSTMVSEQAGPYPYLDTYVRGLRMDFLPPSGGSSEKLMNDLLNYVNKNYAKMDILVLYGPYATFLAALKRYRQLRPDGRVYLALDMNSGWMDRFPIELADELIARCDITAVSCKKLQAALNRKWPKWTIEHMPNGFFNSTGKPAQSGPKEDIILTVGRLGTSQKATHILLDAFAKVYKDLPGWRVHLVGGVEESFKPYINNYFESYPELKELVLFKGLIGSKEDLFAEYARAKIFALSSLLEGGTPNVVSEALTHGCYIITSDIDASKDATDNGRCGRVFPVGDTDALASCLLEVCGQKALLESAPAASMEYALRNFDWDLNIARLEKLLTMRREETPCLK